MKRLHPALRGATLLLLGALALHPSPADAIDSAEVQRARALVEVGAEMFREGKHEAALEAFSKASDVLPDRPRLHWNMGRCREELEDFPGALADFERYLEKESSDRQGIKEALEKVAALRVRLRPKAATVRVESNPSSAAIFLDGEPVGTAPVMLEVKPGEHSVEARAKGLNTARAVVRAEAGVATTVSLVLSKAAPEADTAAAAATKDPPGQGGGRRSTMRPILVGAAGIAATALAVTFFLRMQDSLDQRKDVKDSFRPGDDGDEAEKQYNSATSDAQLNQALGWTFIVPGAAALGFAIYDLATK